MATKVQRMPVSSIGQNPTTHIFQSLCDDIKLHQKQVTCGTKEAEFSGIHPSVMRRIFRQNTFFKYATSGICKGFTQANVSILPSEFANDFAEFCRANSGPLPLLFSSTPGQFTCPDLVSDEESDIRTDIAAYNVFEDGVYKHTIPDLLRFENQLKDFCSFYLGCSFSFDDALLNANIPLRNLEKGIGQVSMYETNVQCRAVGPFDCPQVVSMRAIPKALVEKAVCLTAPITTVHGAPMHIGDPAVIGIQDVHKVDYGVPTHFEAGDIPVFWPCGVTGLNAIKSVGVPLAFSHSPGSMFISDVPTPDFSKLSTSPEQSPKVIWLKDYPAHASVLSNAAYDKINQLQELAADDPGQRNIAPLVVEGDLVKSTLSLSHANSVALITGFPLFAEENPYETDGPAGLLVLAQVLLTLGKEVTFIVDNMEPFGNLMKSVIEEAVSKGALSKQIPIILFSPDETFPSTKQAALDFLTKNADGKTPRFDHMIASERVGRAKDGQHYTMKGRNMSHMVGDLDVLFKVAKEIQLMSTTGIGDGGNEIGMGKVQDRVKKHIPFGEKIACTVATDYLIVAGVSDWGAHALCNALFAVYTCPIHDRYRRRAVGFPPSKEDIKQLRDVLPNFEKIP